MAQSLSPTKIVPSSSSKRALLETFCLIKHLNFGYLREKKNNAVGLNDVFNIECDSRRTAHLWKLQPVGNGRYYIINRGTGNYLAVKLPVEIITTKPSQTTENKLQWWINRERGTIASACNDLALNGQYFGVFAVKKHSDGFIPLSQKFQIVDHTEV